MTTVGVLTLTLPFTLTKSNQEVASILHPIEHKITKEQYSTVCTRNLPVQAQAAAPEPEVIIGDFPLPVHCKEPNCGIGVYSPRKDSDEERCTYCGSLKPISL